MIELQQSFFLHAIERNQIWRIFLGMLLIVAVYFATIFGMTFLLGHNGIDLYAIMMSRSPQGLAVMLLSFFPVWMGVAIVNRVLHKRRLQALYGPSYQINWFHFLKAAGFVITVILTVEVITQLYLFVSGQDIYRRHMIDNLSLWCLWALPMLVFLMIQIGAEEILFRGYLLQTISARGGNFIWAAVLPSVIFGCLHFDYATFGANAFAYVASTAVFGMILCAVTLRLGNIGAAFGLHFFNNLAALFIYGLDDELGALTLFHLDLDPQSPLVGGAMVLQTIIASIAFFIWRRRFKVRSSDVTLEK